MYYLSEQICVTEQVRILLGTDLCALQSEFIVQYRVEVRTFQGRFMKVQDVFGYFLRADLCKATGQV